VSEPILTGIGQDEQNGTGAKDADEAAVEHTWRRLDLVALGSAQPQPPEIGGLIYGGKRVVISGEDDSGKTMLMAGIAADELDAGRGVVWVDTDDMGASALLERLRAFGADDDTIRSRFAYLQPEEALTDAARDDVLAMLAELHARLLVTDAFNASLVLHGYNPHATDHVEAFWQRVVAPFCHAEVAVVLTDHVVKQDKARGRYSYGSERKATGSDLHLGLKVIDPFGRGKRGAAKIRVHRDRIGFLQRPSPGTFALNSDPETGRLTWQIEASHERSEEGEFRPTRYMEKVSDYLARFDGAASRRQVEDDVTGKAEYIRTAIDRLVAEEFAMEFEGARGARMVEHVKPFREADEGEES
jgi:hypothetical protein